MALVAAKTLQPRQVSTGYRPSCHCQMAQVAIHSRTAKQRQLGGFRWKLRLLTLSLDGTTSLLAGFTDLGGSRRASKPNVLTPQRNEFHSKLYYKLLQ